jgi:predicted ATP-dependent protease
MDRTADNHLLYARMIGTIARQEGLRPLDRTAVARVIEQSARLAGDAEKLSTHVHSIADLLREADYWAGEAQHHVIAAMDVQHAIDGFGVWIVCANASRKRSARHDLDRYSGHAVGQVNGLSVLSMGSLPSGRPNRITARVRLGRGEVVDIEREVAFGGPIHSKGVDLSAYLGARYAADRHIAVGESGVRAILQRGGGR